MFRSDTNTATHTHTHTHPRTHTHTLHTQRNKHTHLASPATDAMHDGVQLAMQLRYHWLQRRCRILLRDQSCSMQRHKTHKHRHTQTRTERKSENSRRHNLLFQSFQHGIDIAWSYGNVSKSQGREREGERMREREGGRERDGERERAPLLPMTWTSMELASDTRRGEWAG